MSPYASVAMAEGGTKGSLEEMCLPIERGFGYTPIRALRHDS